MAGAIRHEEQIMKQTSETIVTTLRDVADAIEQVGPATVFPACGPDDDPFVDKACETIEHGGALDATALASLVRYIADMMEE